VTSGHRLSRRRFNLALTNSALQRKNVTSQSATLADPGDGRNWTGKALKHERLQALMGDGGIQECGFAQNCVEVCPKDIPLTKAIADTGREVMKQAIKDFFRG
jgi:hypothetical protein